MLHEGLILLNEKYCKNKVVKPCLVLNPLRKRLKVRKAPAIVRALKRVISRR